MERSTSPMEFLCFPRHAIKGCSRLAEVDALKPCQGMVGHRLLPSLALPSTPLHLVRAWGPLLRTLQAEHIHEVTVGTVTEPRPTSQTQKQAYAN